MSALWQYVVVRIKGECGSTTNIRFAHSYEEILNMLGFTSMTRVEGLTFRIKNLGNFTVYRCEFANRENKTVLLKARWTE